MLMSTLIRLKRHFRSLQLHGLHSGVNSDAAAIVMNMVAEEGCRHITPHDVYLQTFVFATVKTSERCP